MNDERYSLPVLPGMQICLDPEGQNYDYLKRVVGDKKIYVYSLRISNEGKEWNCIMKDAKDYYAYIITEDKQMYEAKYNDFFEMAEGAIKLTIISTREGEEIKLFNDESITPEQEKLILKYGATKKVCYDNEWRARIIQHVLNERGESVEAWDADDTPKKKVSNAPSMPEIIG